MSIRKEPFPSESEGSATLCSGPSHSQVDGDIESIASRAPGPLGSPRGVWARLSTEVDPGKVSAPLAAFSFMTGFMDAVSFSAIFVWCGFQTGNFVQLSIAASRLFGGAIWDPHDKTQFGRVDQQALASLISFNVGASLGRIGDGIGPCSRLWLVTGTLAQALFTVVASIAIWKSGQPSLSTNSMLA